MKKVLYVSIVSEQVSGGTSCMKRNLELLRNVPNINVHTCEVKMQSKVQAMFSALTGGNLILSSKDEKRIIKMIKENGYDCVFQEGTTSGHLAKSIAKLGVRLIVFAHNVETNLYRERVKSYRYNIFEYLKYFTVKRNEKKSVINASTLISLTQRDADYFRSLFDRGADVVIPISSPSVKIDVGDQTNEEYGLFVGSNFFPNNEGISWFIKNVVPYINIKIKVVGSCCQTISTIPIDVVDKVDVLGLVDDLNYVYRNASFVVVPLFKGSGMKTKTIEAMSYGKTIFGTDECFQGIQCNYEMIGGLCNTAQAFVDAINQKDFSKKVNEYTVELFEKKFSNSSVQEKFNSLFK